MKNKSWLNYLIYLIQLVVLIYMDGYAEKLQNNYGDQTYGFSFTLVALTIAIKVSIGLTMGTEHLTNEMKKVGIWTLNLPKILVLVLPSLYFSISRLVAFVPSEFLLDLFVKPANQLFQNNTGFISIFQILFGYFLITSLYKKSKPAVSTPN